MDFNNTIIKRFDKKANYYAYARPGYSSNIQQILNTIKLGTEIVVADVGAGTGIFSSFLLDKGYTVYSIEPNTDMRSIAEKSLKKYPKSIIIAATAENTTLPAKSVDLITAAQSFHWFSVNAFKNECLRILKDGGQLLLIWNLLNSESKLIKSVEQCMHFYNTKFHGFNAGIRPDEISICIPYAQQSIYTYNIVYNKNKFRQRWLSSSFSPTISSEKYTEFIRDIDMIFDIYATNGRIIVENQTVTYIGTPIS